MDSPRGHEEHEEGLAAFVTPQYRARFRASLATIEQRDRLRRRLAHFRHLDLRFADPVAGIAQRSNVLGSALRARGASDRCYLLSEDDELDGREMSLDEALSKLVDEGSMMATFISCIPGRLAYFHDEEVERRYLLERPR